MGTSMKRFLPRVGVFVLLCLMVAACAQATPPPQPTSPPAPTAMPAPATYTPGAPAGATAAPAATSAPSGSAENVNAFGVTLPADAAPASQQYIVTLAQEGTTCDFAVSVYKRTTPAYCSVL